MVLGRKAKPERQQDYRVGLWRPTLHCPPTVNATANHDHLVGRACRQCEKADPEGPALETSPASPRLAQRHGRQGLRLERRTSAGLSHSIVSVDDAGRAAWSGDFELI